MLKICITGSGPVAIALALFLRRQGISPQQIFLDPIHTDLPESVAARAIALSQGSVHLLSRLGRLPAGEAIRRVDIGVLRHGLHSLLDPLDIRQPALGRVVRYRDLWASLVQQLENEQAACGHRFEPTAVARADAGAEQCVTIIADGRPDENATRLDFEQAALTCEVTAPSDARFPAPGVAYERFKPDGPLALLPLPEPHRLSLVWCMKPNLANELKETSEQEFANSLASALGPRFSRLTLASERFVTRLQRVSQHQPDGQKALRLGNAAQTLHPVAGQGMNLGLRDAFEVAALIGAAGASATDTAQLIRQALRQRLPDRQSTMSLTDSLARLDQRPVLAGLNNGTTQSMAIALLDVIGPLRRQVARRFVFGRRRAN